jgi:NAD(P)-dependent dehydrogenase (short-subunit alcohol dehydrogenase family)
MTTGPADGAAGVDLRGQVALVTGGGRGIGRAIAQALAAAGAAVVVTARSADELAETVRLIETAGGQTRALPADVTDRAAIEGVVVAAERAFGPVTLLVNNAGVLQPIGLAWEVDPDAWWRCLEVNLRGPYLCARAVLPGMVARRAGRIVNIASVAAGGAGADATAYASSKTALVRLTEGLAVETREFGVGVFAVDPGNVETAMHAYLGQSAAWLKRRGRHAPHYTPAAQTGALVAALAAGRADALSGRFLHVSDNVAELAGAAEAIRQDDRYALRVRR